MKINFEKIPSKLCNLCGNCVAVCPANALSVNKGKIHFNKDKCIFCARCYTSCPGREFLFSKAQSFFKKFCPKTAKYHPFIGIYSSIYVGQSTNKNFLETSTTGGLVPEILKYAFEKKIIDKAIFLSVDSKNPLKYKFALINSKEELSKRVSAFYQRVPLNSILKQINDMKGKFAIVGLPCHIEGIRKLQMANYSITKKIVLVVGTFCGLNQTFEAINFILSKLKIKEKITSFSYRKKNKFGWPGGIYIKTESGEEYFISKDVYWFLFYIFAPERCLVCYNFSNEFADISLGEAWSKHPSYYGWNDIIVRTRLGEEIIRGLVREKKLILEKSSPPSLIKNHKGYFLFKKKGVFYRMRKMKLYPKYRLKNLKIFKLDQAIIFYTILFLRSKLFKLIVKICPITCFTLFSSLKKKLKFLFLL